MAKERAEQKRYGQRERKGEGFAGRIRMQERVVAVARHGGFFISDLTGRASLGKSGAGEGSAEHFIKKGCGKVQRKTGGLPGCGASQTQKQGCGFSAERRQGKRRKGLNEREKEKPLKEGLSFLDLGVLGRVYFTDT